ncbi:hypothetical protein L914_03754 [Phytophthora nicotianae]|uniref:Uncharacterized protein n=1 Tax=Phytophthora nicotianae TaxID=4792 RepID=W2NYD2_PHYNI|nr:hypothetical protein L914_03754 [Phytophthora nicotianae]
MMSAGTEYHQRPYPVRARSTGLLTKLQPLLFPDRDSLRAVCLESFHRLPRVLESRQWRKRLLATEVSITGSLVKLVYSSSTEIFVQRDDDTLMVDAVYLVHNPLGSCQRESDCSKTTDAALNTSAPPNT